MDIVVNDAGQLLFNDHHPAVKAWLLDPANASLIDEDTRVIYGNEAPRPWTAVFASEYLTNYDTTYPEG